MKGNRKSKRHKKKVLPASLAQMGGYVAPGELLFFDLSKGEKIAQVNKEKLTASSTWRDLINDALGRRRDVVIVCCCREHAPAHCYLSGKYPATRICRCPVRGQEHSKDCILWPSQSGDHEAWRKSGKKERKRFLRKLYLPEVINGRLAVGEAGDESASHPARRGSFSNIKAPVSHAASLLALLDAADLNVYRPGTSTRDWGPLAYRLTKTLIALAPYGVQIPHVIHNGSLLNPDALPRNDGNKAIRAAEVIGAIRHVVPADGFVRIYLEEESRPIEFSEDLWSSIVAHSLIGYAWEALAALQKGARDLRVLIAAAVTASDDRRVYAHAGGLVVTTSELIPVESRYELAMANDLIVHRRHFVKDIFLPARQRYRVDFRLLDMAQDFAIEVNGMDTDEYHAQKQEVEVYLKRCFRGRYVIWWAIRGAPLPDLPPPDGKR